MTARAEDTNEPPAPAKPLRGVLTAAAVGALFLAAVAAFFYLQPDTHKILALTAPRAGHFALFAAGAWAAYFLGRVLTRRLLGLAYVPWEVALALGFLAFGFGAFLLAAARVLYAWPVRVATAAVVVLSVPTLVRTLRGAGAFMRARRDALTPGVLLLGAAALPFALAILVRATQPPLDWDVMVYHLYVPKVYMAAHRLVYLPRNVYASMPLNAEMMITWAQLWTGLNITGALVAPAFNLLALVATWRLARLFLDNVWAVAAAVLLLVTHIYAGSLPIADVDFVVAALGLMALYLYLRGAPDGRTAVLVGVLVGAAIGTKYTGGYILIAFAPLFALDLARRHIAPRHVAAFAFAAVVVFLPWMAKAYVERGDPLFPALYGVFGGRDLPPDVYAGMTRWLREMGMGRAFGDYLLLPYRLSFLAGAGYHRFDGFLLPFSILSVVLAFIWFRRWRLLLFTVAYFLAWAFLGSQQMRFLSAEVALFAITNAGVLAAGAARLRGAARTAFTFAMITLAVGVGWYFNFPLVYGGTQGLAYYALGSADQYLLGAAPHYPAAKFINENLPPDAVVLMVFDARPYYVERRVVYDSFDEASETLLHVQRLNDAGEVAAYVRSLGATHILIGTATPAQYWKYYASSTRTLWESYLRGYADVIMTFPAYELREIRTQ